MPNLLIRNIEPTTIARLKLRAKQHHRTLQSELKTIVETATKMSMAEAKAASDAWQKRLADRSFSDSAEALRKDRDR